MLYCLASHWFWVVQVVMDFHAHLNMNEVIGLLAGECDEDRRLIRQVTCFQSVMCASLGLPLVLCVNLSYTVVCRPFVCLYLTGRRPQLYLGIALSPRCSQVTRVTACAYSHTDTWLMVPNCLCLKREQHANKFLRVTGCHHQRR